MRKKVRHELSDHVSAARSQPYYLDVTHPAANKGSVVDFLACVYLIPKSSMATIGDMPNDVLMFNKSGMSIAMGNASPEVQAEANFVTDSNEEEGFAHAIERFVLNQTGISSVSPSCIGRQSNLGSKAALASRSSNLSMDSIAQIGYPSSGAKRTGHFVKIVAATAALAGLLFGFDTGVISGAILFIKGEFRLTPFAEELLVSAALIGAVCGSILSGRLTDLIGRKRAILITAGIFAVGSILCAIATSTGVLLAGRIAIGVAIGVASYTAPLYIGEMAPPKLRGGLVTLNQLAITVGILVAYMVDAAFASNGNWRLMFGFGVFPALALGLGIAMLPESPRWLLLQPAQRRGAQSPGSDPRAQGSHAGSKRYSRAR